MNRLCSEQIEKSSPGLIRHLFWINIGLMALFIGLFVAMVVFTEKRSEQASLLHWLESEAERYEADYLQKGVENSWPNPYQFDIYWSEIQTEKNPAWLVEYQKTGFYERHIGQEDQHLLVRSAPSGEGLYYIVYKSSADDYLDGFEHNLHIFAASLGLLALLILLIYMNYTMNRVAKPLRQVLEKINRMPPDFADFKVDAEYQELRVIEQALLDSKRQIADFFRREQDFSRFSAHEIRTPLMVMQGSAQILERLNSPDIRAQKALNRIKQSCDEMALLTETFLMLGKQQIEAERFQACQMNLLVKGQLQACRELLPTETKPYSLQENTQLVVQAPEALVLVLVRNLLKNALSYSSGTVRITIDDSGLCVYNPYQANRENLLKESSSYGYGLEIVERICQTLGWQFSYQQLESEFCARVICDPKNRDSQLGCW